MVTIQAPRVIDVGDLRTLSWALPDTIAHAAFEAVLDSEVGLSRVTLRDRVRKDKSVFVEVSFRPEISPEVFFAVYHVSRLLKEVAKVSEATSGH